MKEIVICLAAFGISGLTLFCGFGLGTLLMPVLAVFFTLELAISITAVVHLLNNLFKLSMLAGHADRKVIVAFGIPAFFAAILGANLLVFLSRIEPITTYSVFSREAQVSWLKIIIGALMLVFAVLELTPWFATVRVKRGYLPVGGVLSGFFGGLSGHQGALRSAFLIKAGLEKEAFIATGVVISCIVDLTRLVIYSSRYLMAFTAQEATLDSGLTILVVLATLSAFAGAFIARRLLDKVTYVTVRVIVSVMLFLIAVGLISGLI